jgi:hypothetical protein
VIDALLLVVLSAGDCAQCHQSVAASFAQSRHAKARTLPVFALSFPHAGTPWCLSCHQPEGRGTAGHTCDTCHRDAGGVKNTRSTPEGARAHPVTVDPLFAATACARCHEFTAPFPGHLNPVVLSNEPLQSTSSEQQKAMPGATCVTCHDPHRAPGAHDAAMLTKAISVKATADDGGVTLEVQVGKTGHRFPTGDPFRRLVLATCSDQECTDTVSRRSFSRGMGLSADGGVWTTLRDKTLASGERTTVSLRGGRFWSARYYFGDPRFESQLSAEEVFVEVARGTVQ